MARKQYRCISPVKYIEVPVKREYSETNFKGKEVYQDTDRITFDRLLAEVRKLNIPESEYKNVHLFVSHEHRDWPTLYCEYHKSKTPAEISRETKQAELKTEQHKKNVALKRVEREKKKAEKQKALDSLTYEQREALGIKPTKIPTYKTKSSNTPGYAGRDEIGGSDFS